MLPHFAQAKVQANLHRFTFFVKPLQQQAFQANALSRNSGNIWARG
jgi:hypothetical protein